MTRQELDDLKFRLLERREIRAQIKAGTYPEPTEFWPDEEMICPPGYTGPWAG